MLVDDDDGFRSSWAGRWQGPLKDGGHQLVTVSTGASALMAAGKERFNVAVVNVLLRAESGYDLLRDLRQVDAKMPVMLMSSVLTGDMVECGLKLGASHVFPKPFTLDNVLGLLAHETASAAQAHVEFRTLHEIQLEHVERVVAHTKNNRVQAARGKPSPHGLAD